MLLGATKGEQFRLGALPSRLDVRDLQLGKLQAPILLPVSFQTDISWLETLFQNGYPFCGSFSGSHLKAILDYPETNAPLKYSPIYLWKKIKAIDGHPPEVGTDMRSIFKALLNKGVCDYELLPTDFTKTLVEQTKNDTTPVQEENAQPRIISSYAFVSTDAESLKQAIYQNKVVLVRLYVGNTWWGWEYVRPYTRKDGGHFVVLTGYDTTHLYALDSADKEFPLKRIPLTYKIEEAGVAVDIDNEVVIKMIDRMRGLQKLVVLYQKLLDLFLLLKKIK